MNYGYHQKMLAGRRYIVTGATGGAGHATALLLAQCGASVTVRGRNVEALERLRREMPGSHNATISGTYDGLFHAAGVEHIGPCSMISEEAISKVFTPSIMMAFEFARDIGKRQNPLIKDGGSVVIMSSVAAQSGTTGMTIYAASKGAVESLVRSAAIEWAPRRIRCNAIRAGAFESTMHLRISARSTPEGMEAYAAKHPLGFGKANDIANAAVFLLSDLSKWVTGSMMTVDGGFSCQ